MVGNNSDCYEKEEVSEDIAKEYAKEINALFMLTSVKTGDNVQVLFETLVRKYLGQSLLKKLLKCRKTKVK